MSARIRVLIADDHPDVRMALSEVLARGSIEIIGEACNGQEAVDLTRQLQPDVDVSMPILGGIEATRLVASRELISRVVGLSLRDDEVEDEICDAGAITFVSKLCEPAVLIEAIHFAAESPPRKLR